MITSLWDETAQHEGAYDSSIEHIGEAQWTEALVVAPATANILAKFAHGIADDFLTTMYLATTRAGAGGSGDEREHVAASGDQANLDTLRQRGVRVIEPGTGDLACGMVGAGRMAEPEAIADVVLNALGRRHDLAGEDGAGDRRRHARGARSGALHRQPLQRQDGLCAGGCGAEPRRQSHSHQRAYGAASAGALRSCAA